MESVNYSILMWDIGVKMVLKWVFMLIIVWFSGILVRG